GRCGNGTGPNRADELPQVALVPSRFDEGAGGVDRDEGVRNGQLGYPAATQVSHREAIGPRIAEHAFLVAIRRPAHHVKHLPGELRVDPRGARRRYVLAQHSERGHLAALAGSVPVLNAYARTVRARMRDPGNVAG